LKYSHMTIGEISNSLGFDNGYSFSTFFKKLAGVSPREYREEKRLQ
jgi:AraC-like DNA-binding protein